MCAELNASNCCTDCLNIPHKWHKNLVTILGFDFGSFPTNSKNLYELARTCECDAVFFHRILFSFFHILTFVRCFWSCSVRIMHFHNFTKMDEFVSYNHISEYAASAHMVFVNFIRFENEKRHICVIIIKIMNHFQWDFSHSTIADTVATAAAAVATFAAGHSFNSHSPQLVECSFIHFT